jgi:putative phosphoribosyl transferase
MRLRSATEDPDAERTVLAVLPRGGVAVGAGVARCLRVPLEVLVTRKISHPEEPELGLGAIAEGGEPVFDTWLSTGWGCARRTWPGSSPRSAPNSSAASPYTATAGRTTLAVPVAPAEAAEAMRAETGEVVTLVTPRRFRSVGEWYAEFGQLTDSDVLTLLAALR